MKWGLNIGPATLGLAGALALGLAWVVVAVLPLEAQTAVSADGVVESTSGGFKFPDGTVQTSAASSSPATVEDTGQQGCWDASGNSIACSGTGQDGELQRGVSWPAPRFTDNGDGTVTDKLTGLIWLKTANCLMATKKWEDALSEANSLMSGECGLTDGSLATDWRLPNRNELLSLLDLGETSPTLPSGHPFTNVVLGNYWSSSSFVPGPTAAWYVAMSNGGSFWALKTVSNYVWPVRGGQ